MANINNLRTLILKDKSADKTLQCLKRNCVCYRSQFHWICIGLKKSNCVFFSALLPLQYKYFHYSKVFINHFFQLVNVTTPLRTTTLSICTFRFCHSSYWAFSNISPMDDTLEDLWGENHRNDSSGVLKLKLNSLQVTILNCRDWWQHICNTDAIASKRERPSKTRI